MFRIRIRELREAAGYKTQQAFADAFGVAQSTIGNWEAGKREPNYETTKKLALFFNVTVDYLLGLTDNPTPIQPDNEPSDTKIGIRKPVSILAAQYHVSADVLASIVGVDHNTAEAWILGIGVPSEDDYACIADFFKLDIKDLKRGVLPLSIDKSVQHRLELAEGRRFAAYGKSEDFTPEELRAIDAFIDLIKSQRGNSSN